MSEFEDLLRVAAGFSPAKAACRACASSAVTMSGLQTVDGVSLVLGDRVLRAISSDVDNGIYVVSTGIWQRAVDLSADRFAVLGSQVPVLDGTVHALSVWLMTSPTSGKVTLGATSLEFQKLVQVTP